MSHERIIRFWEHQLARERGPAPKREALVKIALAHPNTYHVGMSNLGLQAVYQLFNEGPSFLCERFFLPPATMQNLHRTSRTPLLTLENRRPTNRMDVLAFTVSFEFDYIWLLRMLKLSHIPILSHQRKPSHPLVIVGGPCAWMNPLPIAPYVDAFAMGDGEPLVDILRTAFLDYRGREQTLEYLATQPGFYVPAVHGMDPKELQALGLHPVFVLSRGEKDPAHSVILTPDTEFSNTFLIEIMRGCPHWCRFCWIGYNHLPLRFAPRDRILHIVREKAPPTAVIGLIGASPADHPEFRQILDDLRALKKSVTVSSLRIDTLDFELLESLRRAGKKNLTMAPETGSDELRRIVHKPLTNQDLERVVEYAARLGFQSIKLYFILGLPGETQEHLEETVHLMENLSKHAQRSRRNLVIRPNFNCLIPKPNTPFQFAPMEEESILRGKIQFLKSHLHPLPRIQASFMNPVYAYYQAILSLGGVEVSHLVECVEARDGAWRSVVKERLQEYAALLFYERSENHLPFRFLRMGHRADFLTQEYVKAQNQAILHTKGSG